MGNEHNLRPVRTKAEARERGRAGGKASGAARRRKAVLRETMNQLLTMQVEVDGLSDVLRADGMKSTYEAVIAMAMIQQASQGDVKAYQAIMQTVGQTDKSEADLEEQEARLAQTKARTAAMTGENENKDALDRLDQILKEVRENAVKQETE